MPSLLPPPLPLAPGSTSASPLPPDARSLLIQGNYPATAVIHYAASCLSDSAPNDSKVLILSPSKESLHQSLTAFNDKWLNDQAGNRTFLSLLDRISIFYPSNPRLCSIFLARLTVNRPLPVPTTKQQLGYDLPLTLILLHDLSRYFIPSQENDYTTSSYIKLISQAFDAAKQLSKSGQIVRVALFDSGLQNLRLPLIRSPRPGISEEQADESPPDVAVAPAAQRYFHWFGTVKDHPDSNPFDLSKALKELRLASNEPETSSAVAKLTWQENRVAPVPWTDLKQTDIIHVDGTII